MEGAVERTEGFLWKKGKGSSVGGRRNWKQRYFVISASPSSALQSIGTYELAYYDDEARTKKLGTIDLRSVQIDVEKDSKYEHHFSILEQAPLTDIKPARQASIRKQKPKELEFDFAQECGYGIQFDWDEKPPTRVILSQGQALDVGVQEDDVLVAINGTRLEATTEDELRMLMSNARENLPATLTFRRSGTATDNNEKNGNQVQLRAPDGPTTSED